MAGFLLVNPVWADDDSLKEPLPGTLTDLQLQDDVAQAVLQLFERRFLPEGCQDVAVTPAVLKGSNDPTRPWVERWASLAAGFPWSIK